MVILCGGFGRRLKEITQGQQKVLSEVDGEPFLAHLMRQWIARGISRFVLSVGYRGQDVVNYFGFSFESAEIEYVFEDKPLGTGGAFLKAAHALSPGFALLSNGDTMCGVDGSDLTNFVWEQRSPVCLVASQVIEDTERYDV
jgi:Nucleoside-diphosphate-sugar pyrophosphorylase involved in lipopolysaccharide biosynthesis/translation initiation factor 2B, gamma/epsilon subunits (eIF-2Bgamma/eIF-2Bepsilon)